MDYFTHPPLRPDGFDGQSVVVLPESIAAMAARHPLLLGLRVTDAGYFPKAFRHGIERHEGSPGAIFILCREGRGWIRLGDSPARQIGGGEAVLIGPGHSHAYWADESDPWTIQWSHFEGTEIPEWWKFLTLPPAGGILRLQAGLPELLDLGRVHERLGYQLPALLAASAALRWALANLRAGGRPEIDGSARQAVERVERWMHEHAAGTVTLGGLARKASLSPSHFSHHFRRRFGYPPIDYFLRLKVARACHLLTATEWPVARVAAEVGLSDPLYFSRRFRAVMGVSPTHYRNR